MTNVQERQSTLAYFAEILLTAADILKTVESHLYFYSNDFVYDNLLTVRDTLIRARSLLNWQDLPIAQEELTSRILTNILIDQLEITPTAYYNFTKEAQTHFIASVTHQLHQLRDIVIDIRF